MIDQKIFSKFPVLHTERLDLRQVLLDDADLIYAFNSDIEALRHIARDPFDEVDQAAARAATFRSDYLEHKALWWTFVLRDNGTPVGYGGLFGIDADTSAAEVGYGLVRDHWGRGYAGEAVAAMVSYGIGTMRLHRIHARVHPGNAASEKILENLGFLKEGVLRDVEYARSQYFDMSIYGLIIP